MAIAETTHIADNARFMPCRTDELGRRARHDRFFPSLHVLASVRAASSVAVRTTIATLLFISLGALGSGCGSTPEGFVREQARIGCRTLKRCDKFGWNDSDYKSVRDCMDEQLDDFVDDFVDACDDFDAAAARKCLRGMRKVRRSCDAEAPSREQENACRDVCGGFRTWTMPQLEDALARVEPPEIRQRRVFSSRAAQWLAP